MRVESAVTSISWIPSEAVRGMTRAVFDVGVTSYDDPPPERIEDIEALAASGSFRFANELRAWVEIEDGKIVKWGQSGKGHIGITNVKLGGKVASFPAVPLPDIKPQPDAGAEWVRFVQTAGGRTALPAPRPVARKPFVQITAPLAWTTLALTIRADGTSEHEVPGASSFPRHWIYDDDGKLVAKTGLIDFKTWYREAFGSQTPWGDQDSPAIVTAVESALERELSMKIMRGGKKPRVRKLSEGATLVEQGDKGEDIFLLLDGVLRAEVSGEAVAEIGPDAIVGERALLEGGTRTSTLRAVTPARVAVARGDDIDRDALAELAEGHRREDS